MLKRIAQFFQRVFGFSEAEVPYEDAADIVDEDALIVSQVDESPKPGDKFRSRSLSPSDETAGTSLEGISIREPRFLWCLDNGHGSLQPGKRSPLFEDETRFEEWEFNRDVVRRMAKRLDELGIQFFIVVPEDNVGKFLSERVERANSHPSPLDLPKIYLSIHANAAASNDWNDGVTGIETWHYPESDSGSKIASVFQRKLMESFPDWKDRGIRSHERDSGKVFFVLSRTRMPAVLTENGFYTDRQQAKDLMSEEVRQRVADTHIQAILRIEKEGYEEAELYPKRTIIG